MDEGAMVNLLTKWKEFSHDNPTTSVHSHLLWHAAGDVVLCSTVGLMNWIKWLDKRMDQLDIQMVQFIEGLAASIGIAMERVHVPKEYLVKVLDMISAHVCVHWKNIFSLKKHARKKMRGLIFLVFLHVLNGFGFDLANLDESTTAFLFSCFYQ